MKYAKPQTKIEVRWKDISVASGWKVEPEAMEMGAMICTTIGYVLSHDKDVLRMCSSLGDIRIDQFKKQMMVGQVGDIHVIPSEVVVSWRVLK